MQKTQKQKNSKTFEIIGVVVLIIEDHIAIRGRGNEGRDGEDQGTEHGFFEELVVKWNEMRKN